LNTLSIMELEGGLGKRNPPLKSAQAGQQTALIHRKCTPVRRENCTKSIVRVSSNDGRLG
jgi:hypothetical protein